jgi:uncharacterized membrane protein
MLVLNPWHLDPSRSGAGAWLHWKLALVLALLGVSHARMFRARRILRERASGATEGDLEALRRAAQKLGRIDLALTGIIIVLAIYRVILFTR